jgi:hypothetical protein
MRTLILSAALFLAGSAFAEDSVNIDCTVNADKDDLVVKGKDLIVEGGRVYKDAIAVDGNVILKKGARVKSAVALHGSVTVEAGAQVLDSVVAVGGGVKVEKGGRVKGSRVWIDNGIHVVGEDGKDLDINLTVDGKSLGETIIASALKDIRACKIVATDAGR